jgi:hypothetical protein
VDAEDLFERHTLERLRRSIAMLAPGRTDGLDRDRALSIIAELQRLQHRDRQYADLVGQLRTLLAAADVLDRDDT